MRHLRLVCLVTMVALLLGGCGASDSDLLAVDVRGVVVDPETQSPILFLVDPESEKGLPVWIGLGEARAISLGLEERHASSPVDPRPDEEHVGFVACQGGTGGHL